MLTIYSCSGTREKKAETFDQAGLTHKTILIGNQLWMAENLRVTHYRNGDPIEHLSSAWDWANTSAGAYCSYNNDTSLAETYGFLYNGHAVNDPRGLAPEGWRIPSPEDIYQLMYHLQGDTVASGSMRADTLWHFPNTGATNESGFTALPGGYRSGETGTFHTMGSNAYYWTTSNSFELYNWTPRMYTGFVDMGRAAGAAKNGLAVRCIKE